MEPPERGESVELDGEWLKDIAEGNRESFDKLYQAYQYRVFRFLIKTVTDTEMAQEISNDVFIEIWKSAKSFKGISKPSTWIFGIAHNWAMKTLGRQKGRTETLDEAWELVDPHQNPEKEFVQATRKEKLQGALQRLNPEHREVMELTYFQGLSYQEISEIVQCPVNTVKTRMFYAKKQLRGVLQRMGIQKNTL